MGSVNKVILMGNLGADPEVRYTSGGQAVATLSIATTERWKNKQTGNTEEKTEWHRVVAWGRLAELSRDYLAKGRAVYIEGRLQTRKWEDKEGQTRYTTEIVAATLQFIGGRDSAQAPAQQPSNQQPTSQAPSNEPPAFDADSDVPF